MAIEFEKLFEGYIEQLADSLDEAVQAALSDYRKLQASGNKGHLSHVYISFLLSSVLCKLPLLRIDLFDENDKSDITECCAYWNVPCISNVLYRNADAMKMNRVQDYEIEQSWLDDSSNYSQCFERFLPQIIEQCEAVKELNCQWHFGQYLGMTTVVRERRTDEIL